MSDRKQIQERLAAPFENVQWRLQQTSPKDAKVDGKYKPGTRGLFMAYIDARQLYDRLDDVFGFGNWQRIVKAVNADKSVIVALVVKIDDEWITHEDIGYPNNPGEAHEKEPLKAAVSDGAKRAGVGLGIGRFLYELDARWVEIDEWGKPKQEIRAGAPRPAQSTPQPQQEQVPPRARTTTQNTVPVEQPQQDESQLDPWTLFWNAARGYGLPTKREVEAAIGVVGPDGKAAKQRLDAWAKDNAHQKAMVP